ncbi:MAG: hypothetical protein MUC66_01550 [Methanolinea sp.]|jgi:hypothetical protein|nr:hypothetical protein [Methanolinea sp.]
MKLVLLFVGCLLLAVTGMGLVSADAESGQAQAFPGQPQLPHSFYGTIVAAGNPVPAGVTVEARAEGMITGLPGNPVFSREGRYGSADPLVSRLEVQGNLPKGTEVTFFVGGIQAEVQAAGSQDSWSSSYPFSPGAVTELNLRVASTVTPDPGYHEPVDTTLAATPMVTLPVGGVNPSTDMMIGLIAILVILGVLAFYLGRRAEKAKNGKDQETGERVEEPRKD